MRVKGIALLLCSLDLFRQLNLQLGNTDIETVIHSPSKCHRQLRPGGHLCRLKGQEQTHLRRWHPRR